MLGMTRYPKEYVAACRAHIAANVAAWRKHAGKTAPAARRTTSTRKSSGLKPGDEVRLTERDFARLVDAFFAELEKRFA
jgi:hypothetical protein